MVFSTQLIKKTMASYKPIASVVAENTGEIYTTKLEAGDHLLISDEPVEVGGKDEGPAPGALLCMSLASCKVITLRMYANRKGWKVDSIKMKIDLVKGTELPSGNNTFYCELTLTGDLTEEQKLRLMDISKACPIQKLLMKPTEVVSVLV
jgi:putative redox protein